MTDDIELLRRYADASSESAFSELVARHLPLIYSAALRQVGGDWHLAQDVTQSVFTDLARKAGPVARRLSDERQVLSGWLYTSTRFAASKLVRAERRRSTHEHEAVAMQETVPTPVFNSEPEWELLSPVLDDAMSHLAARDRDAVLLRYFEGQELKAVGARLGLTEDAARMRVKRALEKLRDLLVQRGVTFSTPALAGIVSGYAVQAVPVGLATTVSSSSITAAAASAGITFTMFKVMTMTKLKVGAISSLVVAGVATPLVIQNQSLAKLREDNRALIEQNRQITQLQSENRRLTDQLAQTGRTKSLSEEQFRELLRLRGEVNVLHRESQELAKLRTRRETAPPAADNLTENKKMLPADAWADVGMDTPENALQTFFWAAKQDNAELVGKLIRWHKDASVAEIEGLEEIVASLIPGTIRFASELQGMTILSEHEEDGDTARVQVEMAPWGDKPAKQQELLFVKEDTQWKPVFSVWAPRKGSIQGALGKRAE